MRGESSWQKLAERPTGRLSVARDTHDDQLRRELLENLTTDAARRSWLMRFRRDRDRVELLNSVSHRRGHCAAFGADSRRIRGVLDVTALPDTPVAAEQRCA